MVSPFPLTPTLRGEKTVVCSSLLTQKESFRGVPQGDWMKRLAPGRLRDCVLESFGDYEKAKERGIFGEPIFAW
jgi:hypothetical protein